MSTALTVTVIATASPVNVFAESDILFDEIVFDEVSEEVSEELSDDVVVDEVSDQFVDEDPPEITVEDDSAICREKAPADPAGGSYISPLNGAYYINGGTVKLNGLKTVDNYMPDYEKLHTAVYEDQMYEYHGGKIYIGNEVILPGSKLPESAVVTETAADAEGNDANGDAVSPVVHTGLAFDGQKSYVYNLKDIPAEVLSCFDPKDYDVLDQNYADVTFPKNHKFYAWEYEKDANGSYTRKSVREIPSADISWDESAYVSREDNDGNVSNVYSFSGSVRLSPDGDNPVAIVAYLYDAWDGHQIAEYSKGNDEIVNAIGQTEYSGDRSSFHNYFGCGVLSADDEDMETYRPVRERADHFTDGFSLYPFYYHKDLSNHRLTLYGFHSRMGQFMSGYSDLSVDDYYLDTLRIPAAWTDPDTSIEYDVAIASVSDGACSIDPGYAGTVIISDGVAFPNDCSGLFGLGSMYLQNFIVEGAPASVGSNITNMSDMFSYGHTIYSTPLNTVDVAALNTSNVTDMSHMFEGVEVSSLDVSHFDVSHVTDFSYMFHDCAATSLDVSGWEAGKSTGAASIDMSHMFEGEGQFNEGSRLKRGVAAMGQLRGTLDLSGFKFDYVTDMANMFANQGYITKIIFPENINTSRVTDMKYLFSSCSSLAQIRNIERFNTSSVTDMGGMFGAWNVPAFIETRAGDYSGPWLYELMDMTREEAVDTYGGTKSQNDGPALTSLDLSGWNTSRVKNMAGMFSMPKLTTLTLSDGFHTEQVRNMSGMFTFPVMTDTNFLSYISIRDARLANMMIDMP
ncbi:MAG: DUF285 domain-containing protein, partial [Lachnospiraceae bacterium]|nr:DUF285 domain-containing protein [Lachnospiraceae bacterium]